MKNVQKDIEAAKGVIERAFDSSSQYLDDGFDYRKPLSGDARDVKDSLRSVSHTGIAQDVERK